MKFIEYFLFVLLFVGSPPLLFYFIINTAQVLTFLTGPTPSVYRKYYSLSWHERLLRELYPTKKEIFLSFLIPFYIWHKMYTDNYPGYDDFLETYKIVKKNNDIPIKDYTKAKNNPLLDEDLDLTDD